MPKEITVTFPAKGDKVRIGKKFHTIENVSQRSLPPVANKVGHPGFVFVNGDYVCIQYLTWYPGSGYWVLDD